MTRAINAILFDLGETLLDFGRPNVSTMFRRGAQEAYRYLQQLGQRLPSKRWYHIYHWLAIRCNVIGSFLARREFHSMDVLVRCCKRFGIHLTANQHLELCWQWYKPLSQCATTEPNLREMLQVLHDKGLKLVVVSNTFVPGEILDRHLADAGLLDLLPLRIYSCDVGCRKPDRRIFQAALDAVSLPADQVVFVGDTPRADIYGANRLGMVSVLKDPQNRYSRCKYSPTHRIARVIDLPDVLQDYALGARVNQSPYNRSTGSIA